MTNSQYPQTRKVWNVTDLEAGLFSNHDGGQSTVKAKVAASNTVKFGTFAVRNASGLLTAFSSGATKVSGVAMIANQVVDYENRNYSQNETAEEARRGFVTVKIDTTNPPTAFGAVRISHDTGTEGFLTSSTSNSKLVAANEGIQILRVGTDIAEIFLPGKPEYNLDGDGLATQSFAGLKVLAGVGNNGAGSITLTGAVVGDRVVAVFGTPTAGTGALAPLVVGTDVESEITVVDEIQQSSVSDLSGNTYIFLLAPALA